MRIHADAEPTAEPVPGAPAEELDFSAPIDPGALEMLHRQERRRRLRTVVLSSAVILGSIAVVAAVFFWPSGGDDGEVAATPAAADELPREVTFDFTPRVGDCLDIEDDGDVVERRCDRRHDAEMYASVAYSGEASGFPGRAAMEAFAGEACLAAIADYVGVEFYYSGLDFSYFWPAREAWAGGDRTVECLAHDAAGTKLDAPVRGSGGIAHPGFLPPGPDAVGHCLNAEAATAAFTPTVPCDGPHDYEVFAAIQHPAPPGAEWPGEDVLVEAGAACHAEAFETYVGVSFGVSSLVAGMIYPSVDTWAAGNRTTHCVLIPADGEALAASMRGSGRLTALDGGHHFTEAELPGIVLQTYEPPPGTEHAYSLALSEEEFIDLTDAQPVGGLGVSAAFWAEFATPGESSPAADGSEVGASYWISAKAFDTPKAAHLEFHAARADVGIDGGEMAATIGEESWAGPLPESSEIGAGIMCEWRIGNLVLTVWARGPEVDPTVVVEMAEWMAARAAGGEVPPRPAAETDAEAAIWAADAALIAELFEGETAAWTVGPEAAVQYAVDHTYPELGATFDACLGAWFPEGPPDALIREHLVDPATAIRTDDWTLSGGRLAGQPLDGRIYEVEVTETFIEDGVRRQARTVTSHAAILDGEAYGFWTCDG